ncbi:MAG: SRPBCC family protein [Nocardioides sp.]|nr:SRPBCC family protein [Nocardioides sp.]
MTETSIRKHQESVTVDASAEALYDVVADITRTGEWSPVCTSCRWDDEADAGQVGAWFTGHNKIPGRTWETRSEVVAAERGREFAWIVGGNLVRWGFTLAPADTGTVLTETWEFLPDGIAYFEESYADQAQAQIADRTRQALHGIPQTLAAIKRIVESNAGSGDRTPS